PCLTCFTLSISACILALFIIFFFFSCSGHPRDLHSFPTRRSSDLSYFYRSPEQSAAHARALGNPNAVASFSAHSLGLAIDLQMRDRKSTRLNSSHVKISYAVFCLKKKKKKH